MSIYHDADYSLNLPSSQAMKIGLLTALAEINYQIQGYQLKIVEKNHRGNLKRSFINLQRFLEDNNALFVLSGLHSPPYIKYRQFINENRIPLLVPWAAGGPITRYPSAENYVFRLSIDDTKAGRRISEYALNTLQCKNPHLLLEDTAWGKSNQQTMTAYLTGKVPFEVSFFDWNIKQNTARMLTRNIITNGHDCVFLVANLSETEQFINAMVDMKPEKRIPIVSHWGATGGDINTVFTNEVKQAISFHFIQSCFSFTSSNLSKFQTEVLKRAQALFPEQFSAPGGLQAPAGFIHAYDLGRLAIAALQQTKLSGDIKQDRVLFKQALEALHQPVSGLIKTYQTPFSTWNPEQPDAHEALGLDNFCMATFGQHNQINILANKPL
ncbi:ABC transporter substrate-binding protein [Paraglaciecola aestuariivivens]